MLPYLVAFILSIIATYNAQHTKISSFKFYVHSILAVAPLVILAAFRDPQIGTDTENYIILFENALSNNDSFLNYLFLHSGFEVGFLFYNFCVAHLVDTVELYFIITYGLITGFAYYSAMKLRNVISPQIFMTIYVFVFYSETLNGLRQYMAVSLVLVAVANLLRDKSIRYLFWTVIACLFHTSALISIIIGVTYWLTYRYPLSQHKFLYILICLAVLSLAMGLEYFANMGLLPTFEEKLGTHLNDEYSGGISNSHLLVCFCTLVFLFHFHINNPISDLMLLMLIFTMIFYLSPSMNAILYRLVLYFNVMTCFAVAYVYKNPSSHSSRPLTKLLLMLFVAFYFFSIVISKTHEVVPYSSSLMGI